MKIKILSLHALLLLTTLNLSGCGLKEDPAQTLQETSTQDFAIETTDTHSETKTQVETLEIVSSTEETKPIYTIAIDPGHQAVGNSEQEPIGPGATQTKNKVAGGTHGTTSGLYEYELTLSVSLKLRDILEEQGFEVIMIRETHDVNISNAQRAQIANDANVDAFIRVHADGSTSSSANGLTALCQTPDNPYNGDLYDKSRLLSECVINATQKETGASLRGITETDTMSGINWAMVPTTIIEMGFMTNPNEDMLMATEEYQYKLANGMANGIIEYLSQN